MNAKDKKLINRLVKNDLKSSETLLEMSNLIGGLIDIEKGQNNVLEIIVKKLRKKWYQFWK